MLLPIFIQPVCRTSAPTDPVDRSTRIAADSDASRTRPGKNTNAGSRPARTCTGPHADTRRTCTDGRSSGDACITDRGSRSPNDCPCRVNERGISAVSINLTVTGPNHECKDRKEKRLVDAVFHCPAPDAGGGNSSSSMRSSGPSSLAPSGGVKTKAL